MARIAPTAALGLALFLASCGGPTVEDPFGADTRRSRASIISVYAHNQYEEDVVLYVLSTRGIERVGALAPTREKTFRVEWDAPREMRVRVEILAGPRYTTNSLARVVPGDLIEVRVPDDVRRSYIIRR
ncbi:MAG: hypothetical protein PVI57_11210 [Gemmatimonadota bacterium]